MSDLVAQTHRLLELLNHDEIPFGIYYANEKPDGYGPKPGEIFSREREAAGEIDWQRAFGNFSCIMGNVWLARKKNKAAWISHEECGCMGGGYYSGVYAPYLNTNVGYVATGVPGTHIEGERYMPSWESMCAFMDDCAPPPASGKYCILKPLDQFSDAETPLVVAFFARQEAISGLHSLAGYAKGDHNAVRAPFGASCTSLIAWPLAYMQRGEECAVLGGFDLSARKFMKTDEMTFAMPVSLYQKMLEVMEESALTKDTWAGVRKKVAKSREINETHQNR